VRDRRLLHSHRSREVPYRAGRLPQSGQNQEAVGRG
jgi:hypothetical protein